MSRTSDWTVDLLQSGNTWVSDGVLYRPNSNVDAGLTSTIVVDRLARGDKFFIIPEIFYTPDDLVLEWLGLDTTVDSSFITKIKNYVKNNDYLKITTHDSVTFIGSFLSEKRIYITGAEVNNYDMQCVFARLSGSD